RVRDVDLVERPGAVDDVQLVPPPPGQRIDEIPGPPEGGLDPSLQFATVNAGLLRLRVHRHDPGVCVGDEAHFRIGELALAPEHSYLAEEGGLGADRELLDPPRL